jgi:hypothetical protein
VSTQRELITIGACMQGSRRSPGFRATGSRTSIRMSMSIESPVQPIVFAPAAVGMLGLTPTIGRDAADWSMLIGLLATVCIGIWGYRSFRSYRSFDQRHKAVRGD